MTARQEVGKLGEDLAAKYLQDRGYKIIERNYWKPWGELDIIAIAPDKTLIFFEIKSLKHNLTKESSSDYIQPENNLTQSKLKKLQRTASLYANSNSNLIDDNRGWRIDLLAIDILNEGVDPAPFIYWLPQKLGIGITRIHNLAQRMFGRNEKFINVKIDKRCGVDIRHYENI